MKKFMSVFIIVVLIGTLIACESNQNSSISETSLVAKSTTSLPDETENEPTLINGFSLDAYDFKINVDPTVVFNKNSKDEQQYSYGISWGVTNSINNCLKGSWTEIFASIPGDAFNPKNDTVDDFSTSNLVVMYLQIIPKYRLERNDFVEVNDTKYFYDDLKSYSVYENEKYIIYDFTSLIFDGRTYEEILQEYIPCEPYTFKEGYDSSWTKNVYDYFHNHINKIIVQG